MKLNFVLSNLYHPLVKVAGKVPLKMAAGLTKRRTWSWHRVCFQFASKIPLKDIIQPLNIFSFKNKTALM